MGLCKFIVFNTEFVSKWVCEEGCSNVLVYFVVVVKFFCFMFGVGFVVEYKCINFSVGVFVFGEKVVER